MRNTSLARHQIFVIVIILIKHYIPTKLSLPSHQIINQLNQADHNIYATTIFANIMKYLCTEYAKYNLIYPFFAGQLVLM